MNLPTPDSLFTKLKYSIWDVLGSICVNTFGLRMMYPGVILEGMVKPVLDEGRAKLMETRQATRAAIKQYGSDNLIDTVFVDQRNSSEHGNNLIICTDGNASFYEVGIFDCEYFNFKITNKKLIKLKYEFIKYRYRRGFQF